jgi:YggT family protein
VVSWVSADPRNPIVRFLHMATDPLLQIIRRMLPMNLRYFPIDISFLVLLALVTFSQFAIAKTLIDIGARLNQPVVREAL